MESTETLRTYGSFDDAAREYDAVMIVSYGGPEGMDDVMPYLERVLAGKRVPRERMEAVAHHYELFGGVSPINAQNRDLIAALKTELDAHDINLPIYLGNRNWQPFLADTLREMADQGIKRVIGLFTSPYSSYSSCRQYREDIAKAREEVGLDAPRVDKIRVYYNHPGFIEPNVEKLNAALAQIPVERRADAQLLFTAHSIPHTMSDNSNYVQQLEEACRLIAEGAGHNNWRLVYQSRSGPPHQPWLEPDICDTLEAIHETGTTDALVMPVGFISDHMEVMYDLDVEARQVSDGLGLNMIRVGTVGTHPIFVSMIRQLIQERMQANPERPVLGSFGPSHDICGKHCCLYK